MPKKIIDDGRTRKPDAAPLKEIRKALGDHELRFDQIETKMDLLHSDLSLKIEAIRRALAARPALTA